MLKKNAFSGKILLLNQERMEDNMHKKEATSEKININFCSNCGIKIEKSDMFCKNCGKALYVDNKIIDRDEIERKGDEIKKIDRCPCCGDIIDSFVSHCPSCGYEIRIVESSNSIKELINKLESIDSRQMPEKEEKNSFMKMILGKDLKDEDKEREAVQRFENQKISEKVNVIINYPVPNTKENIVEFMILATSNINVKAGVDDEISKAWIQKMEQVYQRAEITVKNAADLCPIKKLYESKKNELESRKKKTMRNVLLGIGAYFVLFGLMTEPVVTIALIILICLGWIFFKKR